MTELLRPFGADQAVRLAAALIEAFGSVFGALSASPREQARIAGNDRALLDHLRAVRAAVTASARDEALSGEQLAGLDAVARYLRLDMGYSPIESVRVLYLSAQNRLLADETVGRGSATVAPLSVRPIVHRALDLGASRLVLVHNHPSGDPAPSRQDVSITRALMNACRVLDVDLLDHLVVARTGWTSLRAEGLL